MAEGLSVYVGTPTRIIIGNVVVGPPAANMVPLPDGSQRLDLSLPSPSEELIADATAARQAAEDIVARADAGEFGGRSGIYLMLDEDETPYYVDGTNP